MSSILFWVSLIILLAWSFSFINGFHDAANAIATSVTTKALTPQMAIILAAICDFLGALTTTSVAQTIGKGIVQPQWITPPIIAAALIAAILWNLFTWWSGIPSSSSHALIGGLIGAVIMHNGFSAISWNGLSTIILGLFLTPFLGLVIGYSLMTIFFWFFRFKDAFKYNEKLRHWQIVTTTMTALSHGTNDAQKSMGIVTLALISGGYLTEFNVPLWVILTCATAMSLGTASGGWRIIRTMGQKITRIEPINGLAADISSSLIIFTSSVLGLPVSTSHVVSSSIMGTGSAKRLKSVKWGMAKQMVTAWFITIPISALLAGIIALLL